MFAGTLAACGGGGDDSPPPPPAVVATADTVTVNIGQTAQLLANDLIGNVPAVAGNNVTFALTSAAPPAGIGVDAGLVSVGATAAPGVVSLSYRICETANANNCASANVQLTVPPPVILAGADSFNLAAGGSADLLANDSLGGTNATAARVLVAATAALPAGISLSATGLISVATGTAPGSYAIGYRICQTTVPSNCAAATATVTVPAFSGVSGRAIDSASAAGVAGVRVRIGALSAVTDASGAFAISGVVPADRVTVVMTADTHAEAARVVGVSASRATDVQVRLVRVGATTDVVVASGGTVTVPGSTAQVVLPPAGVQRADGSVPAGSMRVRVTPIDPASDTSVMPGDFTTLVAGVPTPIESFGAVNVRLQDSAGVDLNLRTGQTASIRIPVATRSSDVPATIPLFFFDNASGRWVQEGSASLRGSGTGRYYEGNVSHFSTWNADRVMDTVSVTSCLADANGVRVPGAFVQGDGIDYSGTSSATADAGGNFTLRMRRNSVATVVGLSNGVLTNTLRFGPYSVDTQLTTPCLALGQAGAGVTMKLTWGARPSDLDSYLYAPNGSRVNYNNRGSLLAAPFVNLDVDDTSSFGPEVITLTRLMVGTYKYAVNNYSGQSGGLFSTSPARVELSIPGRAVELFTPPIAGETTSTDWWLLFELDVDAQCNVTVRRSSAFASTGPTSLPSATPVYCNRP